MSVDGVWKVEMLGPYGWERVSTGFLDSGSYRTASKDHFSQGVYALSGDHMSIEAEMTVHGEIRSLFGRRDNHFRLKIKAEVQDRAISGKAEDQDGRFSIPVRYTRLADLVTGR